MRGIFGKCNLISYNSKCLKQCIPWRSHKLVYIWHVYQMMLWFMMNTSCMLLFMCESLNCVDQRSVHMACRGYGPRIWQIFISPVHSWLIWKPTWSKRKSVCANKAFWILCNWILKATNLLSNMLQKNMRENKSDDKKGQTPNTQ